MAWLNVYSSYGCLHVVQQSKRQASKTLAIIPSILDKWVFRVKGSSRLSSASFSALSFRLPEKNYTLQLLVNAIGLVDTVTDRHVHLHVGNTRQRRRLWQIRPADEQWRKGGVILFSSRMKSIQRQELGDCTPPLLITEFFALVKILRVVGVCVSACRLSRDTHTLTRDEGQ